MLMITIALPVGSAITIQNTSPAASGFVGINIVGKFYMVIDPDNLLDDAIQVNDTIRGKYVYDPGIPDSNPDPSIGHYAYTSSSCGFELKAGGFVFKTNPSDVSFIIQILNDYVSYDMYTVWSGNNLQLSNGMIITEIYWQLMDYNQTAISSDELPTTAPVLDDWGSGSGLVILGKNPSNPLQIFEVRAHITKATKNSTDDTTVLQAAKSENVQSPNILASGFIGIKIVAKVLVVLDPHNLLGGVIQVDDRITGKYVYDSGTPDTNPNPNVGEYHHTSSSCGIEVKAGGLVFKTNPNDVDFLVLLQNDEGITPADYYSVFSYNNLQLSNGMLAGRVFWDLKDDSCTALSTADLPTTAPMLADWNTGMGLNLEGSNPSDPSKTFLIIANVTKATKNIGADIYETENSWAAPSVAMSYFYNQPFKQCWIKVLERFPNAFPILRHLLEY